MFWVALAPCVNFAAFETSENRFTLGVEYETKYFLDQGTLLNICSLPKPNLLHCYSYEPVKVWNITTEFLFSRNGMMITQNNLVANVSAKKYYDRMSGDTKCPLLSVGDTVRWNM